jgi:Prenyltransferase and squalene oxidase repeat
LSGLKRRLKRIRRSVSELREGLRPAALAISMRRRRSRRPPDGWSRETALEEAISWLYRSQDAGEEDGSRCFRLAGGWSACYPEVTGYNLYTLLDHHALTGAPESRARAIRMADWLLTRQLEQGAYQSGYVDRPAKPVVFNTAQVLQGLVRAAQETSREAYFAAARRAADWLVASQDPDGAWRRNCYLDVFRVTDTRIAFPLAEAWKATGDPRYRDAAERSLDLVGRLQQSNGWFPQCDNSLDLVDQPNTHTLAYTAEGLLESGYIFEEPRFIASGQLAADAMLRRFEIDGRLRGRYDSRWRPTVDWACLTGCAQMASNWLRLYQRNRNPVYLNAALKMNDYLSSCQDVGSTNPGIRGAISGSDPIGGGYQAHAFPSWATKYFCDALIAERLALSAS